MLNYINHENKEKNQKRLNTRDVTLRLHEQYGRFTDVIK